jgi:integrase
MTIKVRWHPRGWWEIDIHTERPDGTPVRERRKSPVSSKSGSREWAVKREKALAMGLNRPTPDAPTFDAFALEFLDRWVKANQQRLSTQQARERVIRLHLRPVLHGVRLDEIREDRHVQEVKARMADQSPHSINAALSLLGTMLRLAVRWKRLEAMPCAVDLIPVRRIEPPHHDATQFARLVDAARAVDWKAELVVLLGGRAGLRRGEILGLQLVDIDRDAGTITVRRQLHDGRVSAPKGDRERTVPIPALLMASLRRHWHARGPWVLCWDDGRHLCETTVEHLVGRAARLANVLPGIHILRHTYCSHLVAGGAPLPTVQSYAGHASLLTTMVYIHAPADREAGVRALDTGDLAETAKAAIRNRKGGK